MYFCMFAFVVLLQKKENKIPSLPFPFCQSRWNKWKNGFEFFYNKKIEEDKSFSIEEL